MADYLVPLGEHWFAKSDLDKLVADAAATIPDDGQHHSILKGGVDKDGTSVVVAMKKDIGSAQLVVGTAFKLDWNGNKQFGANGALLF